MSRVPIRPLRGAEAQWAGQRPRRMCPGPQAPPAPPRTLRFLSTSALPLACRPPESPSVCDVIGSQAGPLGSDPAHNPGLAWGSVGQRRPVCALEPAWPPTCRHSPAGGGHTAPRLLGTHFIEAEAWSLKEAGAAALCGTGRVSRLEWSGWSCLSRGPRREETGNQMNLRCNQGRRAGPPVGEG